MPWPIKLKGRDSRTRISTWISSSSSSGLRIFMSWGQAYRNSLMVGTYRLLSTLRKTKVSNKLFMPMDVFIERDYTGCHDLNLNQLIIPPATKLGGVYWNHHVRLSVRPSVVRIWASAFGFPAHNCFPFIPIIMKLHMQTPHQARMCPIDFEVKGQGHDA